MSLGAQRAGRRVARTRMVLYLSLRAVARAMQTMSRAGPKSTSANLRALLASLCALYCVLLQPSWAGRPVRSEEHTSELQSPCNLVCRLLLEKKKKKSNVISLTNTLQCITGFYSMRNQLNHACLVLFTRC